MTARERVLAALRRKGAAVGAVTQSATLEQMEAVGARWPGAHTDAALMARLAGAAHDVTGFDTVRVPFDQTVEAGLLGAEIGLGGAAGNCSVRSHPLRFGSPIAAMPDIRSGRAKVVCDAIALLRSGDAAVIGGVVGPFTLVCELAGVSETLVAALRTPEAVRPYLEFAVEMIAAYARAQVEAGADAICVEDMSASLDLTSPGIYRKLVLPAQQRLIESIDAPVILHICGDNTRILDLMVGSGADALSLDAKTDLLQAVALGRCAVIGGVDPAGALLRGTAEDVRRACAECTRAGVSMLAPGCGIVPATPTANLREMVRCRPS